MDPSATVHSPQLLNTTPAKVDTLATTGADHINNIEQVVINTKCKACKCCNAGQNWHIGTWWKFKESSKSEIRKLC